MRLIDSTELCFWLFLVNSDSAHHDWFRSLYFKIWAFGSCVAVLAMPLITIFTREDVYKVRQRASVREMSDDGIAVRSIYLFGRRACVSLVDHMVPARLMDLSLLSCKSRTVLVLVGVFPV